MNFQHIESFTGPEKIRALKFALLFTTPDMADF